MGELKKLSQLKIKDWTGTGDYLFFSMLTNEKGKKMLSILLHIEGEFLCAYGPHQDLAVYSDRIKKLQVQHEFIYQ